MNIYKFYITLFNVISAIFREFVEFLIITDIRSAKHHIIKDVFVSITLKMLLQF